jgi:RHS repeat-associated protein
LSDYFQTTSIANTSGIILERYVYRAFGDVGYWNSVWTTSSSSSAYAWTYLYGGYQLDPETNLYQVRNRYYHSALGRWINRDPYVDDDGNDAELTQGANLYWYVGNDPIDWTDPEGLKKCYRWFLITFYSKQKDPKGRNSWNKGGLNDNSAATGLTNYSQDPTTGRAARTGPSHGRDSYAYPPGTQVTIHRGNSGTDNRTVQDGGGGFADPRSGAPGGVNPYEWFDLFNDNAKQAAKLGIEIDLVEMIVADNCKCATGWSENPNTPVPPELQKIKDAIKKQ